MPCGARGCDTDCTYETFLVVLIWSFCGRRLRSSAMAIFGMAEILRSDLRAFLAGIMPRTGWTRYAPTSLEIRKSQRALNETGGVFCVFGKLTFLVTLTQQLLLLRRLLDAKFGSNNVDQL